VITLNNYLDQLIFATKTLMECRFKLLRIVDSVSHLTIPFHQIALHLATHQLPNMGRKYTKVMENTIDKPEVSLAVTNASREATPRFNITSVKTL